MPELRWRGAKNRKGFHNGCVTMRILADENFPGVAVEELRRNGHDVIWVRTANPGLGDRAILAWAQDEQRLLVTLDKDFRPVRLVNPYTTTVTRPSWRRA